MTALEQAIATLENQFEVIESLKADVAPLQSAKDANAEPIKQSETYIPTTIQKIDF